MGPKEETIKKGRLDFLINIVKFVFDHKVIPFVDNIP